jgi:hypothetical protein
MSDYIIDISEIIIIRGAVSSSKGRIRVNKWLIFFKITVANSWREENLKSWFFSLPDMRIKMYYAFNT